MSHAKDSAAWKAKDMIGERRGHVAVELALRLELLSIDRKEKKCVLELIGSHINDNDDVATQIVAQIALKSVEKCIIEPEDLQIYFWPGILKKLLNAPGSPNEDEIVSTAFLFHTLREWLKVPPNGPLTRPYLNSKDRLTLALRALKVQNWG